jgi:chorismate--pyruvate lyase
MRLERDSHTTAFAHWHAHVNRVQASAELVDWLTHRASLTARLIAHSGRFRVQRLHQKRAVCLHDEAENIGISKVCQVMERDVLLRCDEQAVVYAHTVLPLDATKTQWPRFAGLGNKSLGTTLFNDPLVERGALHFARLHRAHPLMRRIAAQGLLNEQTRNLWARRSVFKRHGASLLVTEVFLPAVLDLRQIEGC